ncbi:group 3 secretory phospholipase A2 [Erpetoichthys calabaricus]|uniref:group 3 secretory phospholipase A2 n=1 Tax=Erpetoichthys calabaricus TaxID=27687 RepID=UPI00109F40FD|nr:group 3 secretory phospholipase A2 [Erpetoichthys calabaricus]
MHWVLCLLLAALFASSRCAGAPETFCHRERGDSSGRRHLTFLTRRTGQLELVQSIWGPEKNGQGLLECANSGDPELTESYLSLCEEAEPATPRGLRDAAYLAGEDSPCVDSSKSAFRRKRELPAARHKRSWMIPGTLWCGTGSVAANFTDLGVFDQTDKCCREHDHCRHTISAFSLKYGVFNRHLFTVSHCQCDRRFRNCLLGVNDTVSNLVGYGFFNVLKVPCFVFESRMQCTRLYWWGGCKKQSQAPFALLRGPTRYNSTYPEEEDKDMGWRYNKSQPNMPKETLLTAKPLSKQGGAQPPKQSTAQPLSKGNQKSPAQGTRQRTEKQGVTSHQKGSKKRGQSKLDSSGQQAVKTAKPPVTSKNVATTSSTATFYDGGQWLKIHREENDLPTVEPAFLGDDKSEKSDGVAHNRPSLVERKTEQHHKLKNCGCYKHLDRCEYKIPPYKKRFELHNTESRMLYHCNCTQRLARHLRKMGESNAVESLAVSYISFSCFNLQTREECDSGRCSVKYTAVLSRDHRLQRALRLKKNVENRARVAAAPKVKRQGLYENIQIKKGLVKLYDKCLEMVHAVQQQQ